MWFAQCGATRLVAGEGGGDVQGVVRLTANRSVRVNRRLLPPPVLSCPQPIGREGVTPFKHDSARAVRTSFCHSQ